MTAPLGAYTFLPWMRRGIANLIATPDGDASVRFRAAIDAQLEITGERHDGTAFSMPLDRSVSLVGPGDIVGIDPRAIVRTDPRPWITNFEPGYLASIEFYDEDFPWRHTPAAPDVVRHRLRPWLALVVLTEGEFAEERPHVGRPLPSIAISNSALLPPADELWAWAHVHVMRRLMPGSVVPDDMNDVMDALEAILGENQDLACSRLLSPRRLMPDTAYHAFLLPAFERGRLAGMGLDPDVSPHATVSAWDAYAGRPDTDRYPYYFRWYFRTGTIGDFEYLVRLLQPRPVDPRVGTRDIDMLDPGANLPPIDDRALAGVLRLGGALRVPRAGLSDSEREVADRYEGWAEPYPHPFQRKLAAFVNLADAYVERRADTANLEAGFIEDDAGDPDPLVTAPLYGRWHARTPRLLTERDGSAVEHAANWVHELNLDPRHRVTASFGTRVVQQHQEDFMQAAWEQVGDVLAANHAVRFAQLAKAASWRWYARHLKPLAAVRPERLFALTAPMHPRVVRDGTTVLHQTRTSLLPGAAISAPMRRLIRPGARLVRSLPFNAQLPLDALTRRINAAEVTAAPLKASPKGAPTLDDAARAVEGATVPSWARTLLRSLPQAPSLVVVAALLLALLLWWMLAGVGVVIGAALVAGGMVLRARLAAHARAVHNAHSVSDAAQTTAAIDGLPPAPGFRLDASERTPSGRREDSPDAVRFKRALRDVASVVEIGARLAPEPRRASLDLPNTAATLLVKLDPAVTIPARTWHRIRLPERIRGAVDGSLREVMYHPEIDVPMYKPLVDMSAELFLPNLNLIPPNSITVLETHQRFIEAYMVGLNHEFSRELLWREYPTDARGTYFRQFWEVATFVDTRRRAPTELREDLRDIPPIHTWPSTSSLGQHDHRESDSVSGEEVVLVIRGELLNRYPNAVIYAHRAEWPRVGHVPGGAIDRTRQRDLVKLPAADFDHPPREQVRFPLYEAKVDPDIYFFGFDLTATAMSGGSGESDSDDPGWFFVIKERPGEPRFGLDDSPAGGDSSERPQVWNELTWSDAGVAPGDLLRVAALPTVTLKPIPSSSPDDDKRDQRDEDLAVPFSASTNAADLAYVLFQAPVLVAVHGAEMLRRR